MSNELISTEHRYVIDVSYGINQDGFIVVGTESIVYKGLEIKQDGEIKFSCVSAIYYNIKFYLIPSSGKDLGSICSILAKGFFFNPIFSRHSFSIFP